MDGNLTRILSLADPESYYSNYHHLTFRSILEPHISRIRIFFRRSPSSIELPTIGLKESHTNLHILLALSRD